MQHNENKSTRERGNNSITRTNYQAGEHIRAAQQQAKSLSSEQQGDGHEPLRAFLAPR